MPNDTITNQLRLLGASLKAMAQAELAGEDDMCPVVIQDLACQLLHLHDALEGQNKPPQMRSAA